MKNFNIIIILSVLMALITANAYAGGTNIVHTTSISAANFKPYNGKPVTESNGCYSEFYYSNLRLPVGSVLIGAKLTAIDTIGTGQLSVFIKKQSGLETENLLEDTVDLKPLEIVKHISALQPYTVNEDEFYSVFVYSESNTVKFCGLKVYTVPASEILFFNGFE